MSDDDKFDNMTDDLIEQYLLFLRGRGPEPDTSMLPSDRRAKVIEQFEILAAIADREPELPPLDDDPVAIRLGLVDDRISDTARAGDFGLPCGDDGSEVDPVKISLQELASRFDQLVTVEFAPAWASQAPAALQPIAQCTALGEIVAVFVAAVDDWSHEPESVAVFFRRHPDVSAVGLVSVDAERAVVLTAAHSNHSVDPVRGWLAPHSPSSPEPLGVALGRYFDRCLPQWERVADLDELLGLGDLSADVSEVSVAQVAEALRARPRLAHKKDALRALAALDPSAIAAVIVEVQSEHLTGDELVERLARLAEAAAP
jgi:hypothetical protein